MFTIRHKILFLICTLILSCNAIENKDSTDLKCKKENECLELSFELLKSEKYELNKKFIDRKIDTSESYWLLISCLNDIKLRNYASAKKSIQKLHTIKDNECSEVLFQIVKFGVQEPDVLDAMISAFIEQIKLDWDIICYLLRPPDNSSNDTIALPTPEDSLYWLSSPLPRD